MNAVDCELESEVLAAALHSRWPEHLREHVARCAICSDVAAIALAMDDAREEMRAGTVVPDSGRVWWLAQLRARREAAEAAARPIEAAQVIAFACTVGLLAACFGATLKWVPLLAQHSALVLGTAVALFVIPTAVFLVLRD